ncbi:hypothetical protein [Acetonema longum]|uniref:Uncharacterized protein n=1 Tax=Acetonema longum DSM 6540 TaxID=1009370 RepID=F7NMJ2_9FIRM|nr:hypothetical protein [Acetonema longum]EGO62732.1 hypothetical protein ALO_16612 [Acetonema longum DSM 6540]
MKILLRRVTHYLFNGIMTALIMAAPILVLAGYASPEPVVQSSVLREYWDSMLSIREEKARVAFEADENNTGLATYFIDLADMIDATGFFSKE